MAPLSIDKPSKNLVITALIVIQVLFGVNYVVSKVVVGVFPPLVWASLRIIVSTLFMFGIAFALKRPHPKGGWKDYFLPLIPFALLGTVINQASFLKGLSLTTSTNSAILNTLIPVFTLLIVTARGQEKLTKPRLLGFVFAFVGVLIVRNVEHLSLSDDTMIGDLLTILNCLSFAIFLAYSKKFLSKTDAIWNTAWSFFYGSIGLTLISIPEWSHFQWPTPTPSLWAAMAFSVFGATLLTYFLNFWALAHAKSSQVSLFIYLQPIVAALIALVWYGDPITFRTAAASTLIFIGMMLGSSQNRRAEKASLIELGKGATPNSKNRDGRAA